MDPQSKDDLNKVRQRDQFKVSVKDCEDSASSVIAINAQPRLESFPKVHGDHAKLLVVTEDRTANSDWAYGKKKKLIRHHSNVLVIVVEHQDP
ncbi:MAG: hypothetical protein L6R35_004744 [Caloplaca aegaea]|nr:MAG: hypothetical protein L6R35_004744 [Caloplaca aegaea]